MSPISHFSLFNMTFCLTFAMACRPDKDTDIGGYDTGSNDSGEDSGVDTGDVDPNDLDNDGDGYSVNDGDCDDENPDVHPGATEICDEMDNDCDSLIDEDDDSLDLSTATAYYLDVDGDGFGVTTDVVYACSQPDGYSLGADDCNDDNAAVYPGAPEVCDGVVNDCDLDLAAEPMTATFTDVLGVSTDMTLDFSGTMMSPNSVAIYDDGVLELCGDFYATLTIAAEELTVKSSPGGYMSTLDAAQSDHVISIVSSSESFLLENIRITGGYAMDGGGIFNSQASNGNNEISIVGCEITGNHAWDDGGGIHLYDAFLTLVDSLVYDNVTENSGGGIYTSETPIYMENTQVFENQASNGAGLRIWGSTLELMMGSDIHDNVAIDGSGGGLSSWVSTVTMRDSFIRNNSTYSFGGGVMLDASDLTCTASSDHAGGIVGNTSDIHASGGLWVQTNGGDPSFVIQSNNCDWGADVDGDNNSPNDIVYQTGGTHDYDQLETFTCTDQGCQ